MRSAQARSSNPYDVKSARQVLQPAKPQRVCLSWSLRIPNRLIGFSVFHCHSRADPISFFVNQPTCVFWDWRQNPPQARQPHILEQEERRIWR